MLERDILKINLPDSYRVICISDIHGNLTTLKKLLTKINYDKANDYLFILGDLFEHGGKETAPTVDYIYELSKYERVHVISGNNERRIGYMLYRFNFDGIAAWKKKTKYTILMQWAESLGINEITEDNYKSVIKLVYEKYKAQCDFILNLPLVIETDEFICVHSGLDGREDWWETSQWDVWFTSGENKTGKWLINGHTPTYLYGEHKLSFLPIIRNESKTVSIDGGSTIIGGGQLNAFIIEKSEGDIVFSYDYADIYPTATVTQTIDVTYDDDTTNAIIGNVKVIKKDEYFTKCRIKGTPKTILVKNEKVEGDTFNCWRKVNFVSVYKNEIVSVIDDQCEGYTYVRNSQGDLGWVPKEALT